MEKISTTHDDLLLDYLDGKLAESDLLKLKALLENSPGLNLRLEELRMIHTSLLANKLEAPSVNFTQKVMNNLHRVQLSSSLSPKNGLLLIAGMLIAGGLLAWVMDAGLFDQLTQTLPLKSLPAQKYLQQTLPTINVNMKLIINIIIGVNLVVGFIILDRTVLKPFFQRRAGAQL